MKTILTFCLFLFFVFTCLAQESPKPEKPSKFSISAGVGFGLRTAKLNPNLSGKLRDHEKNLLSGTSFFVMPRYQLNDNYSIGLTYRQLSSSTSTDNLGLTENGITFNSVNEKRNIYYVGPTLHYHNIEDSAELNLFISLGYIGIVSDATFNTSVRPNIPTKTTGGNLGVEMGAEYLWQIAPNLYAGASLGYTAGTLAKVKIETLGQTTEQKFDDDKPEGLQFLSFNPVLRLYL